ncbi:type II 3-dehydroquinate dehydratase [Psychroflexus salis]|uniref:3-dehydroquinate dehydratase n=1 Tax=Psychroflexus salis TaxID=1526574 RepID=A0A917A069_9FLAO|nr:type II 3-dehydroquinate dehydratase [Psychroflexus salis]GGE20782.1 3-dehydroquinate dehydratase [Psychroflexus salis]
MKIHIINGPNLNMLGVREPEIYGKTSFKDYFSELQFQFKDVELSYFQSNIEGELISEIHESSTNVDGIVINAAAYTHTSIALADAIKILEIPVVEVHISNIYAREEYRKHSFIAPNALGVISGFGLQSYALAIQSFI